MKNMLLASTSTLHNQPYLEYLLLELEKLYSGASQIIFIPYARPGGISHDDYTEKARGAFQNIGIELKGLHEFTNEKEALVQAEGIFTGGGNTFLLVRTLYSLGLIQTLKEVVSSGTPYLGTSAGTNIAGLTMKTTNDMPIVYPPSFNTLGLVPFNINPHYLDPDPSSTHQGETRETRIKEFHEFNNVPVVGLREGSWLAVRGKEVSLKGNFSARVFQPNSAPYEIEPGASLKELN